MEAQYWIDRLFERHPALSGCRPDVQQAFETLQACFLAGGKLLLCGNGGSAMDGGHIAGELMKGFRLSRPAPDALLRALIEAHGETEGGYLGAHLQGALPAISLASQAALTSAIANDVAADMVYAQQVYGYGRPGDALLCLSTSGGSANVVRAAQLARIMGLFTLALTGPSGGRLAQECSVVVRAPGEDTAAVQEAHMAIYHALCAALEAAFFAKPALSSKAK